MNKKEKFWDLEFWGYIVLGFLLIYIGFLIFAKEAKADAFTFYQPIYSTASQLPSWSNRVYLQQTVGSLASIHDDVQLQFTFNSNFAGTSTIPLFDLGLGGWSDILTIDPTAVVTTNGNFTTLTISSSTIIQEIADHTTALQFFICNDSPACSSRVLYGDPGVNPYNPVHWYNNTLTDTGTDSNITVPYLTIRGFQNWNYTLPTFSSNYDYNFTTSTPGLLPTATTTQGWLTAIWDSTSTSGFSIDCSGYAGGIFSSSTLGAIGCYAQKIPMGIAGMLITPMPFATNYLSQSFSQIQNTFPFSLVFGLQETLESTINSATSTDSLSIPIYGHGSFQIFSSSTLENIVGPELKEKIFTVIKSIIWLGTGVGIILII